LAEARRLLREHPGLCNRGLFQALVGGKNPGVNERGADGYTMLHLACRGDNPTLVRVLLEVPGIDVNLIVAECTPLLQAVTRGHRECVRVLLGDPRVCLSHTKAWGINSHQTTALQHALLDNDLQMVKWFLALREPAECTNLNLYAHNTVGVYALIWAYQADPIATRQRLCCELDVATPASLFALQVLLSDDYLCRKVALPNSDAKDRFLAMGARLPLELQMVLAHRALGSAKDVVLRRELDPAMIFLLSRPSDSLQNH